MAFPVNSRYANTEVKKLLAADSTEIAYLARRFAPLPQTLVLQQWYTVTQGDRLDNIAARFVGDPEQFWRICDANAALRPEALTETEGRKLRITLPDGIPGGRVV